MRYVPPAFPIANISIANTHFDLVDRVQILIDLVNSRHIFLLDDISPQFNGAQTVFYMTAEGGHSVYATTAMNVLIDINGTRQEPRVAYNVYKNEITFTNPPLTGSSFHGIVMDVWAGAFTGGGPSDTAYARESGSTSSLGGKTEAQLNVNSAQFVTGTVLQANNANFLGGKAEAALNVYSATTVTGVVLFANTASHANTANTANNATYAYGKTEGQLNVNSAATVTGLVANATYATTAGTANNANNASYAYGKAQSQLNVNAAFFLSGNTITTNATALAIGIAGIYANSSLGSNGQVLTSNGTSLYWAAAAVSNGNATFLSGNTVVTNSTALFVGANVALNTSAHFVGNSTVNAYLTSTTLTINQATVNSTFYTGRANTANTANVANDATYAYGKTEGNLNVNSALTSNDTTHIRTFSLSANTPANAQVLTFDTTANTWYPSNLPNAVGTHTLLQSNVHTDTTNGTVTRGDVITAQGVVPKWTRLPLGTATYVLTSNGTEATWAEPSGAGGIATRKLDDLSPYFNGSQTVFVTTVSGANVAADSVENLLISLAGIVQEPNTAFTLSGNTITFAVAPGTGTPFFGVQMGSTTSALNANNASYLGGKAESTLNVYSAANWSCTTPTFTRVGIGTANAHANAAAVMAGQYFSPMVDEGNSGASKTINWNGGNEHKVTLTANCTLTFSNPLAGGRYVLLVFQDAAGGWAVTWPGSIVWPGGGVPAVSNTALKMDIFTFIYDSGTSTYYGAYSQNY